MALITNVARRYKAELVRGNDKALREIRRAYLKTERRLRSEFASVSKLIKEAEAAGKNPVVPGFGDKLAENEYTAAWLFQQGRYRELMLQVKQELDSFAGQATLIAKDQQVRAVDLGIEHSTELASQQLTASASIVWNTVPHDAVRNLIGFMGDDSPLAYKFAEMKVKVAQGIRDTFASGISEGWGPRKTASAVVRAYKGALTNALVTSRTETMRAYRMSALENYRANDDVVVGYRRLSARSDRTCAGCWAMDNTLYRLDQEQSDHPCGLCCWVPELRRGLRGDEAASDEDWDTEKHFAKLSDADQLQVLGPGRYELYKSGKAGITDMGRTVRDDVWGDSPAPKPLKDLRV